MGEGIVHAPSPSGSAGAAVELARACGCPICGLYLVGQLSEPCEDTGATSWKQAYALLRRLVRETVGDRPPTLSTIAAVRALVGCPLCEGTGTVYTMEDETSIDQAPGSSRRECPDCDGAGVRA
jgi:hypothetical protein